MKAGKGVICDVTPYLCQTPVKGKEEKTSLSNPVEPNSVGRSPSLINYTTIDYYLRVGQVVSYMTLYFIITFRFHGWRRFL